MRDLLIGDAEPFAFASRPALVTVEARSGEPDVRKFDAPALNSAIDKALASLPPGKKVAAFARVDLEGAHILVVGRIVHGSSGELDWTVLADKPWDKPVDAGLGLRWSF